MEEKVTNGADHTTAVTPADNNAENKIDKRTKFRENEANLLSSLNMVAKAIDYGMRKLASSRTAKYFINNMDGESSFTERLQAVAKTIEALRYTKSTFIEAHNGETYNVSDYMIPNKLVDYVNSGRIYANVDAKGVCPTIDLLNPSESKDVQTPFEFNSFFRDFNENQKDDVTKLNLVSELIKRDSFLGDYVYAVDRDRLVKVNESGVVKDPETAYLAKIPNYVPSEYLHHYPVPEVEGLAEWLFS